MRDITEAEKRHIEKKYTCPACEGELMGGPEGGMCKNFKCASCERVWNLCFDFGSGRIFTGQLAQGDDYEPKPATPNQRRYLSWLLGKRRLNAN